jgi:hypothetical protein
MKRFQSVLGYGILALCSMGAVSAEAQAFNPPTHAPWGAPADNKILAQKLVNELMRANPDIYSLGLHAVPPGSTAKPGDLGQIMVAQTFQRIGAPDGGADLDVVKLDQVRIYPAEQDGKKLMRVMVPLRDGHGAIIGLTVILFNMSPSMTPVTAHRRTNEILARLAAKLPDQASLFTSVP